MISVLKCLANSIARAVFPIAVGPMTPIIVLHIKLVSAVVTIFRPIEMFRFRTEPTYLSIQVGQVLDGPAVLCADNASGNSNDPVTHDHDQGGQCLSQGSCGINISITHCRKSYYTPVYGQGNICKTVFRAFYQIHNSPHHNANDENSKKQDKYFGAAIVNCAP